MAESDEPLIHTCHACGALIDISESDPLELVHCPSCGTGQRVRTQFDHFQLQDILGAGGMGAVYRAFDQGLNRYVALKLLRPEFSSNPTFVAQFEREAAITASINHPNVVKVFSSGTDHGHVYIAMELVDKGSLDDLMTLQGRVAELQVLEVGVQIARGLDAALRRGLIHRDVKPGNILFANAHSAKIVDFGLATLQHMANKGGGDVWGTPYYVAPEKLEAPPVEDFRSDMYSLGATLFHAVAGRAPYEAESASMVALKHLKSQPVSIQSFAPDISGPTAFIINKTLSKDANDRYASYEELAQHLEYARTELVKTAGTLPQRKRLVMESEDEAKAMSWITFAMVTVVVIGGLGMWLMRHKLFGSPEPKPDVVADAARRRNDQLQPEFTSARTLLVRGEYPQAATLFEKLQEEPNIPQPLLNWLTLHQGLAQLLASKEEAARKPFTALTERDVFGKTDEDKKLAQFFIDLGYIGGGAEPQPATVAKGYDKSTYQAIGLMVIALKNWQLGSYEEAAQLFRQFRSSTPQAPYQWIADYKPLTNPYIEEYTAYQTGVDAAKAAATPDARAKALEAVRRAQAQLKLKTALGGRLDELIKKLEEDSASAQAEDQKLMAEKEARDAPKLAEAKAKCAPLVGQYRFSEAKAIAEAVRLESDKGMNDRKAFLAHMDGLAQFKARLIRDLAVGYTAPITRRSGTVVPPGRLTATEAQLELRTPYGKLNIPWNDVAADSVIAMAKAQLKPDLSPEARAERQWELGIYAMTMGRKELAREMLTAAAQAREEYATTKLLLEASIPGAL